MIRPTVARVDLDALASNYRQIVEFVGVRQASDPHKKIGVRPRSDPDKFHNVTIVGLERVEIDPRDDGTNHG